MPGQLFTTYFLADGIHQTSEWRKLVRQPRAFTTFKDSLSGRFREFKLFSDPNESVTEQELIRPVLDLLGWVDYLTQQGVAGNEEIPDHLLFSDAEAKARAAARSSSQERYRDALVIEESKRFGLPLDHRVAGDKLQSGTPHGQLLRYLSTADVASEGGIRWGILTNGCVWRLYDYRTRPRATAYFETDLGQVLEAGDGDNLRLFYLLFRRDSFISQKGATRSFLETALAEAQRYEQQVADDLSGAVFESVFPQLVNALVDNNVGGGASFQRSVKRHLSSSIGCFSYSMQRIETSYR